jgi:DNA-directed RNA polymerase II subunit RPB2
VQHFHTYLDDSHGGAGADTQAFTRPGPGTYGMRRANYSKIESDGFPLPGTLINPGDAVIGKVMHVNEIGCVKRSTRPRDQSTILGEHELPARVEAVRIARGKDLTTLASVELRTLRELVVGDKISSMHGQKGVVSRLELPENMPFGERTGTPDVIINPHALPSRMTVGHLFEMHLGLAAESLGEAGDGTPFEYTSVETVAEALAALGLSPMGWDTFYDGRTGKRMRCQVFAGPIYYQTLKQKVDDKVHARARGPVHLLTQQPIEGRAKFGGLRLGEMERDCFIAYGAARLKQERMFLSSDAYEFWVCNTCGMPACPPAALPPDRGRHHGVPPLHSDRVRILGVPPEPFCLNCGDRADVRQIAAPFAWKLHDQELIAAGIVPRLVLDDSPDVDVDGAAAVGVRKAPGSDVLRPEVAASLFAPGDVALEP